MFSRFCKANENSNLYMNDFTQSSAYSAGIKKVCFHMHQSLCHNQIIPLCNIRKLVPFVGQT